jgi:hypothetical protein
MKTVDLNFIPKTRNGEDPHIIDYPASKFIAEELDKRISVDRPQLESAVANDLFTTGETTLELEDLAYIKAIITGLQYDNLLKGQILERFE